MLDYEFTITIIYFKAKLVGFHDLRPDLTTKIPVSKSNERYHGDT